MVYGLGFWFLSFSIDIFQSVGSKIHIRRMYIQESASFTALFQQLQQAVARDMASYQHQSDVAHAGAYIQSVINKIFLCSSSLVLNLLLRISFPSSRREKKRKASVRSNDVNSTVESLRVARLKSIYTDFPLCKLLIACMPNSESAS